MMINIQPTSNSQQLPSKSNKVALTQGDLTKEVQKYVYTQEGEQFLPLPGDRIGLQNKQSGEVTSVFEITTTGGTTSIKQWSDDDKRMTTLRIDEQGNVLKAGGMSFAKTSNAPTIDNNNEVGFPYVEWQVTGNNPTELFHRLNARMEQDQATKATPPKE